MLRVELSYNNANLPLLEMAKIVIQGTVKGTDRHLDFRQGTGPKAGQFAKTIIDHDGKSKSSLRIYNEAKPIRLGEVLKFRFDF